MSSESKAGWREAKRIAARGAIVDAAWRLVHDGGIAELAMRDLAREAGVTTPTLYAYFDSKHAIYDAMFGQAATDFADLLDRPFVAPDAHGRLSDLMHRVLSFCTADVPRYHLMFQRVIPGFEPSEASFAPAVRALDATRALLTSVGLDEPRHLDLWTALCSGLADQQISNDPGGSRWIDLVDDAVAMYLTHCAPDADPAPRPAGEGARRR